VARTASKIAEVSTALEAEAIPVSRSISEVMLNQQPAAAPLLVLAAAADAVAHSTAQTATGLDPADLHWLITGRYGASTPLDLRNLRRRLLAAEREAHGVRNSAELLDQLVAHPDDAEKLLALDTTRQMPRYTEGALRIGRMLAAMVKSTIDDNASAELVLWAGWSAVLSEIGRVWEEQALGDGQVAAVLATRGLDY